MILDMISLGHSGMLAKIIQDCDMVLRLMRQESAVQFDRTLYMDANTQITVSPLVSNYTDYFSMLFYFVDQSRVIIKKIKK